jgi:flagellar basal body-associated protein FliL
MSRPEMQLREYFDAGVERISVEDVIAQAKVSEGGVRPLHMKRSFKPAWAAAGAFVVTLVGIGGLASVLKLTPRIAGDVDAGAGEIVDASGSTIVVWLIAAVVAAVVAGLTVWLVHRSSKPSENEEEIEPDQGKVTVMETIERTETETTQKTEQRSRWPIVVIVVMAIALVGLIAWMTLAMRPNSPTAAPPEIQQLMEDYSAAWNAYDADALEGLVTVNYRIHSNLTDYDMEDVRAYMLTGLEGMDWHVTTEGPYYAVEGSTGTWYVSSEGSTVNRTGKDYGHNGVWKVIDERVGGPLVVEHYTMGG